MSVRHIAYSGVAFEPLRGNLLFICVLAHGRAALRVV